MKLTFFFKKHCLLCHAAIRDSEAMCVSCDTYMQALRCQEVCLSCGIILPNSEKVCGQCLQMNPANDIETHVLWRYEGLAKHLIQRLKFNEDFTTLAFLVAEMSTMLRASYQNRSFPEVIIPVPLHFLRLMRRGFNQSHELGKALAKSLSMPFNSNAIKKIRSTPPQATLSRKERAKNLASAFRLHKPFSYRSVALVDDVMTTGATIQEVANVLKAGGVEGVHVWVLTRALKS